MFLSFLKKPLLLQKKIKKSMTSEILKFINSYPRFSIELLTYTVEQKALAACRNFPLIYSERLPIYSMNSKQFLQVIQNLGQPNSRISSDDLCSLLYLISTHILVSV